MTPTMQGHRFDSLIRAVAPRSRRRLLGVAPAAAVALAPPTFRPDAEAKKRKKPKTKPCPDCPTCPTPPLPPPQPTCTQTGGSTCTACVLRPGASTPCGTAVNFSCDSACASDNDCIGNVVGPYCVSGIVERATGTVTPVTTACSYIATPGACAQVTKGS